MSENQVSGIIVDRSVRIHQLLGPGLLESAYENVLDHELRKAGLAFSRQKGIPLVYDGMDMKVGFRADFIVEEKVVVELKSVEEVAPVHYKQLLTYLRLTGVRIGLLLNFGAPRMKDGIRRVVNGY